MYSNENVDLTISDPHIVLLYKKKFSLFAD